MVEISRYIVKECWWVYARGDEWRSEGVLMGE